MMKAVRALAILAGVFSLVACVSVDNVVTAADIGIEIAKTIRQAKADKPNDFKARAVMYAEKYCELREEHSFEWDEARSYAIERGAPEDKVDLVKGIIDTVCPDG